MYQWLKAFPTICIEKLSINQSAFLFAAWDLFNLCFEMQCFTALRTSEISTQGAEFCSDLRLQNKPFLAEYLSHHSC